MVSERNLWREDRSGRAARTSLRGSQHLEVREAGGNQETEVRKAQGRGGLEEQDGQP